MKLEELMSEHQHQLSKTDWKIYNVIKKHPTRQLTIQELADLAYVSTTTIFRYCQKLGLSGFGELSALLSFSVSEKKAFNFEDLKSHYHMIVRYIDQYNTSSLFAALDASEMIYIYAQSIVELRIAREMVRIFMPIEKTIVILSNETALVRHLEKLNENLLFCIQVDSTGDFPIEFKNYTLLKQSYIVLMSHTNNYFITFDDHLLLPDSDVLQIEQVNYTQYMMSIEILYLKYRLNHS